MSVDAGQQKIEQRLAAKERRAAVPGDVRARAAARIGERLDPLLGARPGPLLGYAATGDEVSVDAALRGWLAAARPLALPRVVGPGDLQLHLVTDLDVDLVAGAYGIREPRDVLPTLDPRDVDTVLVPGVCFDRHGGRIGYGGGFYDRLLPRTGAAVRIGICLEVQLVDRVAADPHDAPVDAVVTEGDVYR
jgi:5-formyltetrahydrofolate cyclo-ligase